MSSFKRATEPATVEVGPPKVDGESRIRRARVAKDALVERPFDGIDTVHDILAYAARTHGTRDAVGWRDIIDIVEEEKEVHKVVAGKEVTEKKTWKYFHLSDPKWYSYVEFQEAVSEISRALVDFGITQEDIVNVYAQTR